MNDDRRPGSRLERALEVFLAAPPTSRGEAERLLQDHPDLHDVLAPMLDVPLPHDDPAAATGDRVLGDYRLVREVGRGAMGVVYEAWQRSLDRRVAVKVLSSGLLASPGAVARFRREAAAAARLRHPNIVEVYGFGSEHGDHFFAMQFVDGASLLDRMAPWRTPERALLVATRIAEALAHAHAQGVVHRDVKPGNVLIADDESILLTDFGVARDEALPSLTRDGGFVGTLDYAAPEQVRGERVDARADVWALGVLLCELVAGARPFTAPTQEATLRNILTAEPPSLRGVPGVSNDLAAVVDRALQKNPARRYASAQALLQDLRALQNGEPVSARLPTSFERMLRWARREPWRAFAAAVVLVAVPVSAASLGYLWANAPRIEAATAEERQRDRDERLANAWFDRTDGRAQAALDHIASLPDDPEVQFTRAWLLHDLGRDAQATALLQRADLPCMSLAREALAGRVPSMDQLLARPIDPLDGFVRAAVLFDSKVSRGRTPQHRVEDAIDMLERSMLLADRLRASDAVQLAFFSIEARDAAKTAHAERVLAVHFPDSATARRLRALLLAESEPTAALRWIADLPPDPDHAAYLANARGRAHERLGQFTEAAAAHREALAIDDRRATDWANLGAALRKLKQYAEAERAVRRATELRPRDTYYANLLALTVRDQGRLDEAEALFAAITVQSPDYVPAAYNLGNLRQRRGDLDGAIDAFRRAAAGDPSDARCVANLGDALARKGDKQEALTWSLRAAELAPDDLIPQYNVAMMAIDLGLERLALQAAQRARQNKPDDVHGYEILARALLAQKPPDGAAALAMAQIANDRHRGEDLDSRVLLARALAAAGRPADAIADLEAARRLPRFADADAQATIDRWLAQLRQ